MKPTLITIAAIAAVAIVYQLFVVTDGYELKTAYRVASTLNSIENVQVTGGASPYAFNLLFNLTQQYQSDMEFIYPPLPFIPLHFQLKTALDVCMNALRDANSNRNAFTVNSATQTCYDVIAPLR